MVRAREAIWTARRLREEKLYKRCCELWEDFYPSYLKMSRSGADRTIRLLEEFGPAYFELSQLTRVSPAAYRAIQPAIRDGALHYRGEAIPLIPRNSRKVAAAVADLRRGIPARPPMTPDVRILIEEIQAAGHELDLHQRIDRLVKCCTALVAEFEKVAADEGLGAGRMLLNSALALARDEMARLALQNGIA